MAETTYFQRGELVDVIAYGGATLRRRAWLDVGRGVLVCSESDYQVALSGDSEPRTVGFPKDDVTQIREAE